MFILVYCSFKNLKWGVNFENINPRYKNYSVYTAKKFLVLKAIMRENGCIRKFVRIQNYY
jgi:hypothetical protein